ncbi:MAG: hypothetical protein AAF515_07670 [Pseudomonadota bacterium]
MRVRVVTLTLKIREIVNIIDEYPETVEEAMQLLADEPGIGETHSLKRLAKHWHKAARP